MLLNEKWVTAHPRLLLYRKSVKLVIVTKGILFIAI